MLNSILLFQGLSSFMDPENSLFLRYPKDEEDLKFFWSEALQNYLLFITPPSTTIFSSIELFKQSLTGISQQNMFEIIMPPALNILATNVAIGMSPAFAGAPPFEVINFSQLFQNAKTYKTNDLLVNDYVLTIDSWFRTGNAVNSLTGILMNWY